MICPECSGKGYIIKTCKGLYWNETCTKCKGKKIIDWIENIVGVKDYYPSHQGIYIRNSNSPGIYIRDVRHEK